MCRFIISNLGSFFHYFFKCSFCSFLTSLHVGLLYCIGVPQTSKMLFIFLCYFFFCFSEWISLINFIFIDSSTCSNSFCHFLFFLLSSLSSELFISLILLFKLRISIWSFLKKIISFSLLIFLFGVTLFP